ncbi:MAG: SRPBCC domain-containing protein [Thermoplasmata archaeon]|nr:SRPBCC domain-containing protein [Thermoplasmata archaeon]
MMTRTKTRTIRLQIFTQTSPKSAFKAISEPELLKRWLLDGASLSLRRGGSYSFTWVGGPTHAGHVLEFVPGKQITLTWQWPGQEDLLVTRLKLEVEPKNAGTVVRLTHSGFPKQERWVDLYGGSIQGWTYFLMNLKSVLDHGQDLRSQYDW